MIEEDSPVNPQRAVASQSEQGLERLQACEIRVYESYFCGLRGITKRFKRGTSEVGQIHILQYALSR